MKKHSLASIFTFAAVLGLSAAAPAEAAYTFQKIADTAGTFEALGTPSINANGQVAFTASLDSGAEGVFATSGGPLTTVASSSGQFNTFGLGDVSINAAGAVAFYAELDSGVEGIYTGSGGSVTTIASSSDGFGSFGPPRINASGSVVFYGWAGGEVEGIYRGAGSDVMTIADNNWGFESFGSYPVIDAGGGVALAATSASATSGIYRGTGAPLSAVIETSDLGNNASFDAASINAAGTVAFRVAYDSGLEEIRKTSGAGTVVIASGDAYEFPSINAAGAVAFLAYLPTGKGIFTGPNIAANAVVREGDLLDGSSVVDVRFLHGLNDAGQIAFAVDLLDGRGGIFLATPVPTFILGDMDGDGDLDNFDIDDFELALTNRATYLALWPALTDVAQRGDINGSGAFDNFDIQAFEQLLTGGATASAVVVAVPEPSSYVLAVLAAVCVALCAAAPRHRRANLLAA